MSTSLAASPSSALRFPVLSADEAAAQIRHGDTIGFSGFTPAGTPKAIPRALAQRALGIHQQGKSFQVGVVTGASTGPSLDGLLAKANAISFRTPYQSDPDLRQRINSGETKFYDMHLSMLPQNVRYGFLGKFAWAVVEACEVTHDGQIVLTSGVGAAPTFCHVADRILIEINRNHPAALRGFHDIYEPADPPRRREIPIYRPDDRAGNACIQVDPKKIAGIVYTDFPDESISFEDVTPITEEIGQNVASFLAGELRRGAIPRDFLPIQSGVGLIANAVLSVMGRHPQIPRFSMFTEVIQDSVIELMRQEKIGFASGVSLTVSAPMLKSIYADLPYFRSRLLLRPQEISNHPEVVRRLGIISINTALEADLFGNINSTHVLGKTLMNGIGGSGDFTRNAFLSIFTCPSTALGGRVSTLVPLVSHMDHSEHSVQVIITEYGVADLRGKDPYQRARLIIDRCAHPDFRKDLWHYFSLAHGGHTPQTLGSAFAMHQQYLRTGDMRGVNWDA